jgi:predicted acyl esterase
MRDGPRLAGDIYLPDDGGRHPCLVQRVPYDRRQPGILNGALDVHRAVQRGFAVLTQDCRGRFASEGDFTPFVNEGADGEDTVAWAAEQDWCDGSVGMFGRSYSGLAQWAAAAHRPPALRAIAPMFSGDDPAVDWLDHNGVRERGFALLWGLRHLAPDALEHLGWPVPPADLQTAIDAVDDLLLDRGAGIDEIARHLPFLQEGWRGEMRATVEPTDGQPIIPTLVVGGWFDIFLRGSLRTHRRLADSGVTDRLALVVGPWAHGAPPTGVFGNRSFGRLSNADAIRLTDRQLDWFDRWLRELPAADTAHSPVTWFHMGADRWLSSDCWPPGTERRLLHLGPGSDGRAGLGTEPPSADGRWALTFDEDNPVPTRGGQTFLPGLEVSANAGPHDQRDVIGHPGVLHCRGERLAEPLDVVGEVDLRLRLHVTLPGTSIVARLVEELPDSSLMLVCEGAARTPSDAEPESELDLEFRVGSTSHRFAAGSRVGLLLSCTSVPRFRRWVTADVPSRPRSGTHHVVFGPRLAGALVLAASTLEVADPHPQAEEPS